jgi:hypothetical protein
LGGSSGVLIDRRRWPSNPDQQLFYYSSRAMCRRHFPDVLLGVYTMDEAQDMQPRQAVRLLNRLQPLKRRPSELRVKPRL